MNRENKKRKYDKRYYRTHSCTDAFICKVCGWPVVSAGAGSSHRNHCPNCLSSIHLDNEPGDRRSECHGRMDPIGVWVRKMENGQLYTGADAAARSVRIGLQQMTIP